MVSKNSITLLKEISKKNASNVFLIDSETGKQITYKNLDKKAIGIAKLLRQFGLKKNARLAVILDNSVSTVYFYFRTSL